MTTEALFYPAFVTLAWATARDAGAADVAPAGGHRGARGRCRPDQAPGVRAAAGNRDRDRGVRRDLEPLARRSAATASCSAASAR